MDAVLQIAGGLEARARTHNIQKRDPVEPLRATTTRDYCLVPHER